MPIIVNTNMAALKAQKNLNNATSSMNTALERLSTGFKINRAADDAANMYIATNLDTQIRGSKVAKNNISTGTNMLAVIEGDLDVMLDNLQRIRDLTVQASNSIYSENSMNALKDEIEQRLAEIDRISLNSNFNGLTLLDGNSQLADVGLRMQVGANSDEAANCVKLSEDFFQAVNSTTLGADYAGGNTPALTPGNGLSGNVDAAFANASAAAQYINLLDSAITSINDKKAAIGATQNRLDAAEASLTTTIENMTEAKSSIMDADIAEETANYTKYQILQQTTSSLLLQANQLPQIAISLVNGG